MAAEAFVTRDQICRAWISGLTCQEIGHHYWISPAVASYVLKEAGIRVPRGQPRGPRKLRIYGYRNPSLETLDKAATLGSLIEERGCTQKRAAFLMDVSQSTASRLYQLYRAIKESI